MLPKDIKKVVPVVMRMGGGIIFVVADDCVEVFLAVPGQKPNDVLELIGTANREHIAVIAAELLAAVS